MTVDARDTATLTTYQGSLLHRRANTVSALLRWMYAYLREGVEDATLPAAAEALAQAKRIRAQASGLEQALGEVALAEFYHSGKGYHRGQDFMATLAPGDTYKEWKHTALIKALIADTVAELTIKYPYVPEPILASIVGHSMWKMHRLARMGWRATELEKLGIDPAAYSSTEVTSPEVSITGDAIYARYTPPPRRGRLP